MKVCIPYILTKVSCTVFPCFIVLHSEHSSLIQHTVDTSTTLHYINSGNNFRNQIILYVNSPLTFWQLNWKSLRASCTSTTLTLPPRSWQIPSLQFPTLVTVVYFNNSYTVQTYIDTQPWCWNKSFLWYMQTQLKLYYREIQ